MTRIKLLSVAGIALLALAALEPAAHAQRVDLSYTGKLDTFTVPEPPLIRSSPLARRAGTVPFPASAQRSRR
jgi:hypothetical protein